MWIRKSNVRRGAVIGGLIGATTLTALGIVLVNGLCDVDSCADDYPTVVVAGLSIGGAGGALLGAGVGALTPGWRRLFPRRSSGTNSVWQGFTVGGRGVRWRVPISANPDATSSTTRPVQATRAVPRDSRIAVAERRRPASDYQGAAPASSSSSCWSRKPCGAHGVTLTRTMSPLIAGNAAVAAFLEVAQERFADLARSHREAESRQRSEARGVSARA